MQDGTPANKQETFACQQGGACPLLAENATLRSEIETLTALVRSDALTGLYNYRHFLHSIDLEMERARRSGKPVSLIMLDLDHFKSFNDTWGHEFGNKTLMHVASLIQNTVRRLDIPCRYGGEEFAVILPDTSLPAAILLAERIRVILADKPLYSDAVEVHVTASMGVDVYGAQDRDDGVRFVQRTDAWLLQAKATGRNRVYHPQEHSATHVSSDERDLLLGGS